MTSVKKRLEDGEVVLGTMIMYVRTPGIIRMAAAAGLDYVLIDMQHSTLGLETVADMCEMARASGIAAYVRLDIESQDTINRYLDLGSDGFMFHDVTTRELLDEIMRPTRYSPNGTRGVSLGGAGSDYVTAGDADALAAIDERQFVIAQIESRAGMDAIESIVASGGIDVIELGRQDLSLSLGVPGQLSHPVVEEAVDRALEVCRAHGVTVGLSAGSPEEAERHIDRGAHFITWRTDKAILLSSYQGFVDATR